jgi:hypothetical protein
MTLEFSFKETTQLLYVVCKKNPNKLFYEQALSSCASHTHEKMSSELDPTSRGRTRHKHLFEKSRFRINMLQKSFRFTISPSAHHETLYRSDIYLAILLYQNRI